MTLEQFQTVYSDIRDAIVETIEGAVDTSSTAIWNRDAFDPDESLWLGHITAPDGSVHCWSVYYTGTAHLANEIDGVALETFVPTFRIIGYRGYDFGTNASNSSDAHRDEVNAIRWAFLNSPRLGLGTVVNEHSGFIERTEMAKIDTRSVHLSRCDLAVELLPIPYDFPA